VEITTIDATTPNTVNSLVVRTREYLTEREIERLMAAARKSSRYGHRDATMILIGYRHGLRACELCDLLWSQVELTTGRLHVRRAKNGSPSVHPMQGDEIRALRRLQRDQGLSSHVFMTERDGPMTPKAFHALFCRIGSRAKMQFPIHPHMLRHGCGYALANAGHDTRALQAWLDPSNGVVRPHLVLHGVSEDRPEHPDRARSGGLAAVAGDLQHELLDVVLCDSGDGAPSQDGNDMATDP
jgi:integrase